MNSQQFKSWFEGFTEQMSGPPNELQWKRIKEKVTALQPGYYYPGGYPYHWGTISQPVYQNTGVAYSGSALTGAANSMSNMVQSSTQQMAQTGYSNTDYFQEGKTDYNG